MLRIFTCFLLSLAFGPLLAQTGCPDCVLDLPDLPVDTIYLGMAPDGQAGQVYSEDLSFRLPLTTTPVANLDGVTPPGLTIDQFNILAVAGLPAGLQWEASQLAFDPAEESDGCVRLCGVPLFPGFYEVEVVIQAQIFILSQQTSFSFPLVILPAELTTEGFTLVNGAGCGSVTAEFENNITSGGEEGFSYFWDFGNGNSSVSEFPAPQTYTEPGTYTVDYQAIVDTAGHYLTQVVVEATDCSDFLGGKPDLKFVLFDPAGENVYTAPIVDNADLPLTWNINIPILEGGYELHVVDNDGGIDGADDLCGVINFSQELSGQLSAGALTVNLLVQHNTDTIRSSEQVIVYEFPAAPSLQILESSPYCEGDTLTLAVGEYNDNLVWYRDSLLFAGESTGSLVTAQAGEYWVTYTSPEGCSATSEPLTVFFNEALPEISLTQEGNLLEVANPEDVSDLYNFAWYQNGNLLAGAEELRFCITEDATYAFTMTDIVTGCSSTAEITAIYQPGVSCSVATEEPAEAQWSIYPNPFTDWLRVEVEQPAARHLRLFAGTGQLLGQWPLQAGANELTEFFAWPAGLYHYQITDELGRMIGSGKLVKR